jgi:pilus assembly protein CpaE
LEQNLGYPVTDLLPNAYALVSDAADNGRMASDLNPDSELSIQIDRMADHIINRPQTKWGAK